MENFPVYFPFAESFQATPESKEPCGHKLTDNRRQVSHILHLQNPRVGDLTLI